MAQILLPPERTPGRRERRPKRPKRARGVLPSTRIRRSVQNALLLALGEVFSEVKALNPATLTAAEYFAAFRLLQDKWRERFGVRADDISRSWVAAVNADAKAQLEKSIAGALRLDVHGIDMTRIFDDRAVADAAETAAIEASSLIRTIPEKYLGDIQRAVLTNYQQLPLPEGRSLTEQIQEIIGSTEERARLIARDQTSKINTTVNMARMESIGIEEYIWRTAKDARVVGKPGGLWPEGNEMHGNHDAREGKNTPWDIALRTASAPDSRSTAVVLRSRSLTPTN